MGCALPSAGAGLALIGVWLAASLLVILATPFWLEARYLLGSLLNIQIVLTWVVHLI